VTLTGERRRLAPYGLQGGEAGACGEDGLERDGEWLPVGGKATLEVEAGDVLHIATPGGGGWGQADD
jgi:N-methylhydantoinase B